MNTVEELEGFWTNLSEDFRKNKVSYFENFRKNKPWEWQYQCCFYDLVESLSSKIIGMGTGIIYTEYTKKNQFWSVEERKKFISKHKEETKNRIAENEFNFIDYSDFPYFLKDEKCMERISAEFYSYKRNFVEIREFVKNNDFENKFPRQAFYNFTNGMDSVNDFYNLFTDLNILKLLMLWEEELEGKILKSSQTKNKFLPDNSEVRINKHPLVFTSEYGFKFFIYCIKNYSEKEFGKTLISRYYEIFKEEKLIHSVVSNKDFYDFVKVEFTGLEMTKIEPNSKQNQSHLQHFKSLKINFEKEINAKVM